MINPIFQYEALPARVVFGPGAIARLPEEASRLRLRRVLVVSTGGQRALAERVAESLGALAVGVHANAVMHTPGDVTDAALVKVAELDVDGIVAVGGGSAIGLSKAIALRTDLPQIVIPTTYAGSEATPILGESLAGEKRTQRSEKVLPETIVYDVYLTMGLSTSVSMASGLNAIAHAAEALYAPDRNPLTMAMAEAALNALIEALPKIHDRADDLEARTQALWGAWLSGCCLGVSTMGLHHKLCHTLGGSVGLPHAETHAVMLPHALAYNLPYAAEAHRALTRIWKDPDPPRALADFSHRLGLPNTLREIGMPEDDIDRVTELTLTKSYPNPRRLERAAIRSLLSTAWGDGFPLTRQTQEQNARL